MTYMGSKNRYCKYIVPIIQKYIKDNDIEVVIDCFCGGANLADKLIADKVICNDLSPSLIALHQQAQEDFSLIPTDGDRAYWDEAYAEWKKMKAAMDKGEEYETTMPLYKIGAIEWYSSFSNGGFPRGYAKPSATRNYYQEAYRNHNKQRQQPLYQKLTFIQGSYEDILNREDIKELIKDKKVLLYCDSPYKGTKPYAVSNKFAFENYYNWLTETAKQYPIFVSEQYLTEDFDDDIVWVKDDVTRTCGLDNNYLACEKLYLIDKR